MKLKKRYVIEYIDNQRDLDYVNSGRIDLGEPWERYKKEIIEEDNAHEVYEGSDGVDGTAWLRFIMWSLFPDQIYLSNGSIVTHPLDCNMMEELYDEEGNFVRENLCELPSSIRHTLYGAIDRQMRDKVYTLTKENNRLNSEAENFRDFLKFVHAEKMYVEWKEKEGRL